ncbi:MAG TPA: hypothetical protein VKF62_08160, partial [Planctomycetota bacterium]|nr:hypothetical protein [Planctomycetota bacterium]
MMALLPACRVLALFPVWMQDSAPAPETAETRLDVRLNPLADLHFGLRKSMEGPGPESAPAGTYMLDGGPSKEAEELGRIEGRLGGPRGWGILEGALESADSARALSEIAEGMPETFRAMGGRDLPLRELALDLARTLSSVEPAFLAGLWPERKRTLEREAARLRSGFRGKEAECLGFMLRSLGMEDPNATIPVFLVTEAPSPGAMTHRRRGGGGVCFVGLSADVEGTLLQETVLHEATHALDLLSG